MSLNNIPRERKWNLRKNKFLMQKKSFQKKFFFSLKLKLELVDPRFQLKKQPLIELIELILCTCNGNFYQLDELDY